MRELEFTCERRGTGHVAIGDGSEMSMKKEQLTPHSSSGEGSLSKVPLIAIVDDDDSQSSMMTTHFVARQRASFDLLDTQCSNLHPLIVLEIGPPT
jgi:hypothetical protein